MALTLAQANSLRIKKLLQAAQLSTEELSIKSNLPLSIIDKLLDGKTYEEGADLTYIIKICKGFNINLKTYYDDPLFILDNLEDTRWGKNEIHD